MLNYSRHRLIGSALGVLGCVSVLLSASHARAQTTGGVGVFVGWDGKRAIAWGVEGFATETLAPDFCTTSVSGMAGPVLRFTMLNLKRPSLTVAGYLGTEIVPYAVSGSVEVGASWRLPLEPRTQPPFSLHTGLSAEAYFWNVSAHQEWMHDTYPVVAGMRVLPMTTRVGGCEN
jgi:hypothetical protein